MPSTLTARTHLWDALPGTGHKHSHGRMDTQSYIPVCVQTHKHAHQNTPKHTAYPRPLRCSGTGRVCLSNLL